MRILSSAAITSAVVGSLISGISLASAASSTIANPEADTVVSNVGVTSPATGPSDVTTFYSIQAPDVMDVGVSAPITGDTVVYEGGNRVVVPAYPAGMAVENATRGVVADYETSKYPEPRDAASFNTPNGRVVTYTMPDGQRRVVVEQDLTEPAVSYPLDLPSDVGYGEASEVNANSLQDRYFYYDGQFHVSYPRNDEELVPAAIQDLPDGNTVGWGTAASVNRASPNDHYFYYDGQYHVTYDTDPNETVPAGLRNLPTETTDFGLAERVNDRSVGDHYFYYDGQYHLTYE